MKNYFNVDSNPGLISSIKHAKTPPNPQPPPPSPTPSHMGDRATCWCLHTSDIIRPSQFKILVSIGTTVHVGLHRDPEFNLNGN